MAERSPRIVLLLGCTASGKSAVSLELARMLGAEIVSIDSMQVYRRMDIGTAKPSRAERAEIPHHLIDVVDPSEPFSVARYVELADRAILEIAARGKTVLALGGTPLYVMGLMYGMFDGPPADERFREQLRRRAASEGSAVLHEELTRVDPDAAARIHPNDLKRIERALEVWHLTGRPLSEQQLQWNGPMRYPAVVLGIRRTKEDLSRRINARVRGMIQAGLVDEVRALLAEPAGLGEQARQALGYSQVMAHLRGEMKLEEAIEEIKIQTRRFAKHQRTWFRKFTTAKWIDVEAEEATAAIARRLGELICARP